MAEQTPNVDPETPADPPSPEADLEVDAQEQNQAQTDSAEQLAAEALDSVEQAGQDIAVGVEHALEFPDLAPGEVAAGASSGTLSLLNDVQLHVKIELGRTKMFVEDVLSLNENSVVELDKAAGDPVDIYVNDRHIARGEVLVLNDTFCVRISEIIQAVAPEEDHEQ